MYTHTMMLRVSHSCSAGPNMLRINTITITIIIIVLSLGSKMHTMVALGLFHSEGKVMLSGQIFFFLLSAKNMLRMRVCKEIAFIKQVGRYFYGRGRPMKNGSHMLWVRILTRYACSPLSSVSFSVCNSPSTSHTNTYTKTARRIHDLAFTIVLVHTHTLMSTPL